MTDIDASAPLARQANAIYAADGSVTDGYLTDGSVRDYIALLKPRVMSLVVFTGWIGLMIAPGSIHPVAALLAVACIAVAAGAAGAINMWYDADIDAVMNRTKGRPIPAGKVAPAEALTFGVVLSVFSVMIMAFAVNYVAAAILAGSILFYVLIYTMWLKRRTPQNIVIGGAAGAFPPMIGWAAVTGGIEPASIVLFALIFVWTPPHFWALALYAADDYDRAGVPMLPVVAGVAETKRQILIYSVILAAVGVLPAVIGPAGLIYGVVAAALGVAFVAGAVAVYREDGATTGHRAARRLFGYSILYLFMIFTVLLIERTALQGL